MWMWAAATSMVGCAQAQACSTWRAFDWVVWHLVRAGSGSSRHGSGLQGGKGAHGSSSSRAQAAKEAAAAMAIIGRGGRSFSKSTGRTSTSSTGSSSSNSGRPIGSSGDTAAAAAQHMGTPGSKLPQVARILQVGLSLSHCNTSQVIARCAAHGFVFLAYQHCLKCLSELCD